MNLSQFKQFLNAKCREDLKQNLIADIEGLKRKKKEFANVDINDIDTLCYANSLDLDYSEPIIELVKEIFNKKQNK